VDQGILLDANYFIIREDFVIIFNSHNINVILLSMELNHFTWWVLERKFIFIFYTLCRRQLLLLFYEADQNILCNAGVLCYDAIL